MPDTEYSFYQVGEVVNFVVPEWYRHETYIKHFATLANGIDSFYISSGISPEEYLNASHHLAPGMHLSLSVIGIKTIKPIRISKCVRYLIDSGAVLTNIHGLALSFELHRELFVPGFSYYGLDVLDYLPKARLEAGKETKSGHKHPMVSVPKSRTPQSSSLGHPMTARFGKGSRFLRFELL